MVGGASSREAPTVEAEGSARGAHVKHGPHVCDAGCVEAQRLVERPRKLPSKKRSIEGGAACEQGGERAYGSGGGASSAQGRPNYGG